MEIEGVVVRVLPVVKGTSARGEWSKQEIILELQSEFNKKVCVSFWGDKVQDVAAMREGERINISINIESREYNGRWFTEVRAWKVNKNMNTPTGGGIPANDLPPIGMDSFENTNRSSSSEEVDDLPF